MTDWTDQESEANRKDCDIIGAALLRMAERWHERHETCGCCGAIALMVADVTQQGFPLACFHRGYGNALISVGEYQAETGDRISERGDHTGD